MLSSRVYQKSTRSAKLTVYYIISVGNISTSLLYILCVFYPPPPHKAGRVGGRGRGGKTT